MLTMLASDSAYLASPASTAYHSSSSPSSPGQASTTSSSDEHPTSLHHHHHHLSFHHTTSSNNFSHMLASDLKTLQGGDVQLSASQAVPAASSSALQPPAFHVPPEMKCQYKTGTCTNMRTTKKNGKLLMLCELHRKKQNEIKKRSDRKQSAMRMNRRLEAKHKAMLDAKHKSPHHPHHHSHHPSFKRTPKFEELLSCDPNQVTWDSHHSHPGSFDAPPPLALPRVNVWRTKDGIATGLGNGFTKSFSFPNPFSPGSGQIFDWSALAPPSVVTTGGTPRGNDLAILEFFLDDN